MKEFVDNKYGQRKAQFFRDQVVSNAQAAMVRMRADAVNNPEVFVDTPMAALGTSMYNGMSGQDILSMYDKKQNAYDSINPFDLFNGALMSSLDFDLDHSARYKKGPTYKARLSNGEREVRRGDITAMGYYPQDWFACGGLKKYDGIEYSSIVRPTHIEREADGTYVYFDKNGNRYFNNGRYADKNGKIIGTYDINKSGLNFNLSDSYLNKLEAQKKYVIDNEKLNQFYTFPKHDSDFVPLFYDLNNPQNKYQKYIDLLNKQSNVATSTKENNSSGVNQPNVGTTDTQIIAGTTGMQSVGNGTPGASTVSVSPATTVVTSNIDDAIINDNTGSDNTVRLNPPTFSFITPMTQPHIKTNRELSYNPPSTDIETIVGDQLHDEVMANHPILSRTYNTGIISGGDEYGPYEKNHLYLKGDWQTRGIIDTTQWGKNKIVETPNRRKLVLKRNRRSDNDTYACGGITKAALGTIVPDELVFNAGQLPEVTYKYESPVDIGLQSLEEGNRDPRLNKFVVKENDKEKIDPGYMLSNAAWNGLMFAGNFAEKMRNDKNQLASVAANLNNTQTPVMAMRGYDPTVNPTHLGYDADPSRLSVLGRYKCGGRKYAKGGIYDLTANEIDEILNNGGKIEFIW